MILKTHGRVALCGGRILLEADFHPGDTDLGQLFLRVEDQQSFESVSGRIRLDPWIADEYSLIEFSTGQCLVLCGAQAVVAIGLVSLAWLSSVSLAYQEAETIDSPWHAESKETRTLIIATDQRVWCADERGAIRWLWTCATTDQSRWIADQPIIVRDRVRVPLRTTRGNLIVELDLGDGLPRT